MVTTRAGKGAGGKGAGKASRGKTSGGKAAKGGGRRTSGAVDKDTLEILFKRIMNLEKDKRAEVKNYNEDIRQLYGELASKGFKAKVVRRIVTQQMEERKPTQEDLDLEAAYRDALGLPPLTPLEVHIAQQKRETHANNPNNGKATPAGVTPAAMVPDEEADGESGAEPDGVAQSVPPEAAAILQSIAKGRVTALLRPGGFVLARSDGAAGAVGKDIDRIHDALIEAGFTVHSGGIYHAPQTH